VSAAIGELTIGCDLKHEPIDFETQLHTAVKQVIDTMLEGKRKFRSMAPIGASCSAASRTLRAAARWPAAILDVACAPLGPSLVGTKGWPLDRTKGCLFQRAGMGNAVERPATFENAETNHQQVVGWALAYHRKPPPAANVGYQPRKQLPSRPNQITASPRILRQRCQMRRDNLNHHFLTPLIRRHFVHTHGNRIQRASDRSL
jgi:hypothetical protein